RRFFASRSAERTQQAALSCSISRLSPCREGGSNDEGSFAAADVLGSRGDDIYGELLHNQHGDRATGALQFFFDRTGVFPERTVCDDYAFGRRGNAAAESVGREYILSVDWPDATELRVCGVDDRHQDIDVHERTRMDRSAGREYQGVRGGFAAYVWGQPDSERGASDGSQLRRPGYAFPDSLFSNFREYGVGRRRVVQHGRHSL